MTNFFRSLLFIFLLAGVGIMGVPLMVDAAQFIFDPAEIRVSAGQEFDVTLRLNTEKQEVNAIQGVVVFPADLLQVEQIRDGGSFITFWLDTPRVSPVVSGTIPFAGMTPGGITEENAFLYTLRMRAISEGTVRLSVKDSQVLLSDGRGTPATLKIATPMRVQILAAGAVASPTVPLAFDAIPPEPFTMALVRDPSIFENQWAVVFATQDKESGIDYYEIKESRDPAKGEWRRVASPALLMDQTLKSYTSVRAVDRLGSRQVSVLPPAIRPWYTQVPVWGWGGVGTALLCVIVGWLWRRRTRTSFFV